MTTLMGMSMWGTSFCAGMMSGGTARVKTGSVRMRIFSAQFTFSSLMFCAWQMFLPRVFDNPFLEFSLRLMVVLWANFAMRTLMGTWFDRKPWQAWEYAFLFTGAFMCTHMSSMMIDEMRESEWLTRGRTAWFFSSQKEKVVPNKLTVTVDRVVEVKEKGRPRYHFSGVETGSTLFTIDPELSNDAFFLTKGDRVEIEYSATLGDVIALDRLIITSWRSK